MSHALEGLLVGRTLCGRYRIDEVIGRGGMSIVYRATDQRLGRPVALKVVSLPAGHAPRDDLRARLRREAASAARIPPHPNVVQVYDYGTDPDLDLDFIVMELLAGRDLKAALAAGPIGEGESIRILRDSAHGIAAGHRAGIVHRDVKPANIFLAGAEGGEMVKILDFGIAKALELEPGDDLTRTGGALPYSPAYASPEQIDGTSALSPASDVYQLGLVGYELLAGERPFTEAERERLRGGERVDLPSRGRWPEVPERLRAPIARTLEPRPRDRYPDAAAFADALAAASGVAGGAVPGPADPSAREGAAAAGLGAHPPAPRAPAGAPPGAPPPDDATLAMVLTPDDGSPDESLLAEESVPDVRAAHTADATVLADEAPGSRPGSRAPSPRRARLPGRTMQLMAAAVFVLIALLAISRLGGEPDEAPAAGDLDFAELDEEFRPLIQVAAEGGWEAVPAEGQDAAEAVERVIIEMNDAWVRGDLARHAAHYADRVDFYNSYGAPRSYIERERGEALDRFPDREITITRSAITFPEPGRARALVDKSWEFGGGEAEWTGSARQELILELRNGVWRVTGERDVEVYESDRSG